MRFFYHLFELLAFVVKVLPYRLLYFKSDLLAPLIHHVIRYRKKVVDDNLAKSFPEKSAYELKSITSRYYRNMTDIIFEIMKMNGMQADDLNKKVSAKNQELLADLSARGKGVVLVMSHSGNWELACRKVVVDNSSHFEQVRVFAKEMSNPYFEKYFSRIRLKGLPANINIIPFTESSRGIAGLRHTASLIVAISDQTPHIGQITHRNMFLNRNTGVFLGPERIARTLGYALVFCHAKHTARGIYNIDYELITDNVASLPEFEATDIHVKMLETDIKANPPDWLWSHRRWKYSV